MEPLRVAMVAACPYPTTQGSQVYIGGQIEALVRRGHQVHVVTYHFGEDLPASGTTIHRTPPVPGYRKFRAGPAWRKPAIDALLAAVLLQVVRRYDIQVIHTHNYEAPLAGYLVRAVTGVPVVYNNHNTMGEELHLYFRGALARGLAQRAGTFLDRQVPRRADHCVAISREALSFLHAVGVPEQRATFVPPGVFTEEFTGMDRQQARRRLGLPEGPVVLYTGNPDRYQDLELLIRAFARARSRVPGATLVLVSGSPLDEYRPVAREAGVEGSVRLVVEGRWPRVKEYLGAADLAAVSRGACSGFPIKLLNYMAAGLPVVATRASAKAVEPGETGLVVGNGDVRAYADALARLLQDRALRVRMGEQARRRARESYHWDRSAEALERVYTAVLHRSRRERREPGSGGAGRGSHLH